MPVFKIVKVNVIFLGLKVNAHLGGKFERRSHQSDDRDNLLVEADGTLIPKRFLYDKADLRDVFNKIDYRFIIETYLWVVPRLLNVRESHLQL